MSIPNFICCLQAANSMFSAAVLKWNALEWMSTFSAVVKRCTRGWSYAMLSHESGHMNRSLKFKGELHWLYTLKFVYRSWGVLPHTVCCESCEKCVKLWQVISLESALVGAEGYKSENEQNQLPDLCSSLDICEVRRSLLIRKINPLWSSTKFLNMF